MSVKPLAKFLFRVATQCTLKAKRLAPYDTGNLSRDIKILREGEDFMEIGNTRLAPYASFVHEGTGIYGKHKSRIIPRKKKALKTPYGVFRSVKGQKKQPYLLDACNIVLSDKNLSSLSEEFTQDIGDELIKDIKL